MRSFFAMIWDPSNSRSCYEAERIKRDMGRVGASGSHYEKAAGCEVYDVTDDFRPSVLSTHRSKRGSSLLVFGHIFSNSGIGDSGRCIAGVSETDVDHLADSDGRPLMSRYWGRYVAFIINDEGGNVINDPTGGLPCYYAMQNGVLLVFSNLERCPYVCRSSFTVDERFIATLFAYDKFQNGATGLNEVKELLGGQRLHFRKGSVSVDTVWDPRVPASAPIRADASELSDQLQSTTRKVVEAWGQSYPEIVLSLSGGLDSAIVAGCLALDSGSQKISAVHYITTAGDGSELKYARDVAAHCGFDLLEIPVEPNVGFPSPIRHPLTARPFRQFLAPDPTAILVNNRESFVGARFTGQGGDHLFWSSSSTLGFADFLMDNGPSLRTAQVLVETVRLSRRSAWHVLSHGIAVSGGWRKGYQDDGYYAHRRAILNERAYAVLDPDTSMPPWARKTRSVRPGKFEQVRSLVHLFLVRDQLDRAVAADSVHPLISQPVVELCLRIPSYILTYHGINRGLARHAFRDFIPNKIRTRVTKGYASRFYVQRLEKNYDAIVEMLADGELQRMGLISGDEVRAFASKDTQKFASSGSKLMAYACIESWLQAWNDVGRNGEKANQLGQTIP